MSKFSAKKMYTKAQCGDLPWLQEYYKSRTPLEGTYEGNHLKKKTCWQGTTSQGKHAPGASGPGADRNACGKFPHVARVRWSCRVEFFRWCVCCCSAGASQNLRRFRCQEGGLPMPKWSREVTRNNKHGTKTVPKWAKVRPTTPSGEQGRTNQEKRCLHQTKLFLFS